ncbi:MAG: DUF6516 family protein [Bacillota bacterium]
MIDDYFDHIITDLITSEIVDDFVFLKKKVTVSDGYLRVRVSLIKNTLLEISIYCQSKRSAVELVDYRFHWQDHDGRLIKRWDNARHHPQLSSYPDHVHVGHDANVLSSGKMDFQKLLRILKESLL